MSHPPPVLSIIVPTYQRPQTLERALASVGPACSASHEVIVVDDCPDGSAFAVARPFGCRYLHKAGIDRGLSASRNLGIELARGRYLAFLDDDDFFLPNGLDRLLAAADEGCLVFADHMSFTVEHQQLHDLAPLTADHLRVCNHIPVGAYLVPRSAIVQRFDTRLRSHEDWDFLLALLNRVVLRHVPGPPVVAIDKTRNQSDSMQARRRELFWLDFLAIYAHYPAPHLADLRAGMLQSLGVQISPQMLCAEDRV